MTQDAYVLAFRASVSHDLEPGPYVESKKSEVIGKKYFGSTYPQFFASINGDDIKVSASAEAKHSAMGRYFLKPDECWEYEGAKKAKHREYSSHIRELTRIRDIGEGIIGIGD